MFTVIALGLTLMLSEAAELPQQKRRQPKGFTIEQARQRLEDKFPKGEKVNYVKRAVYIDYVRELHRLLRNKANRDQHWGQVKICVLQQKMEALQQQIAADYENSQREIQDLEHIIESNEEQLALEKAEKQQSAEAKRQRQAFAKGGRLGAREWEAEAEETPSTDAESVASYADEDSERSEAGEPIVTCREGHPLTATDYKTRAGFIASAAYNLNMKSLPTCDICDSNVGGRMHNCGKCDFDVCEKCYEEYCRGRGASESHA